MEESGLFDEVVRYQDYESAVAGLLERLNPKRVALDFSETDAECDGLTLGRYEHYKSHIKGQMEYTEVSSDLFIPQVKAAVHHKIRRLSMGKYIRKRLIQSIPVVFGITILTYFIMKLAPGGPLANMINPRTSAESILRAKEAMGLNKPIIIQYVNWLRELLQGNFGYSTNSGQQVLAMILERLPATLLLTVTAFVLSFVIGIPLGVYSATHKYSAGDYGLTIFSFIGISIPSFFFGMGLIYIFAIKLKWFPTSGFGDTTFKGTGMALFLNKMKYLVMPALVMSLANLATVMRFTRSSMVETLNQDYIRTARAKGLSEKVVIYRHALKNSLIPVITIFGLSIPNLFGGAYITEKVFSWPGMGLLGVDAIANRDYAVLMGLTLFTAILVLVGNLVADILYSFVDPRIRY